jgi:hypothetical protein
MSREVTNRARSAFRSGIARRVSKNTEIRIDSLGVVSVNLFQNRIIWRDNSGVVRFSFCGWNSSTTRERINGILGLHFYQYRGELCIGEDREIDPNSVFRLVDGIVIREDRNNANE